MGQNKKPKNRLALFYRPVKQKTGRKFGAINMQDTTIRESNKFEGLTEELMKQIVYWRAGFTLWEIQQDQRNLQGGFFGQEDKTYLGKSFPSGYYFAFATEEAGIITYLRPEKTRTLSEEEFCIVEKVSGEFISMDKNPVAERIPLEGFLRVFRFNSKSEAEEALKNNSTTKGICIFDAEKESYVVFVATGSQPRIITKCPKCGTAVVEVEVEHFSLSGEKLECEATGNNNGSHWGEKCFSCGWISERVCDASEHRKSDGFGRALHDCFKRI
jgi:hypothetical protein